MGVSPRSINEIVLGRRAITPEMSLKLGKFFKQSPQFWFNIQTNCDFRRLMKQAHRITAKVKSDFTKLAARGRPMKKRSTKPKASKAGTADGADFFRKASAAMRRAQKAAERDNARYGMKLVLAGG